MESSAARMRGSTTGPGFAGQPHVQQRHVDLAGAERVEAGGAVLGLEHLDDPFLSPLALMWAPSCSSGNWTGGPESGRARTAR